MFKNYLSQDLIFFIKTNYISTSFLDNKFDVGLAVLFSKSN